MNDNQPARPGLAIVGWDDGRAHSFFLQEAFDVAPLKMCFFNPPIGWVIFRTI